jgi:tetratricopeptide (TPR) repeat protein
VNASTPIIEEAAELAEAGGISDQIIVAQQARGQNYLYRGHFGEAAKCFEASLSRYDRDKHAYLSNVWGGDFFAYDYSFLAMCYWHLGRMREAQQAIQKSIEHVDTFDDPVIHTVGYILNAVASVILRAWEDVHTYASSSEETAKSFGMAFQIMFFPVLRGCAMALKNGDPEGHVLMKTHLDMLAANGIGWVTPWLRTQLVLSHVIRGETDLAEQELERVRREASALGENWVIGLFDIAEAEICKGKEDFQGAEEWLLQAITFARQQSSKGVELRAATSLARLWRDQGKRSEAYDLLAPIYDWFTEGFDTTDLIEAKSLLDELN